MLPPIFPDFVGTLSLVSDTYQDLEPFCPVSPVILLALTGTGQDRASGKVQATPVPWHVPCKVGEEHPGLCWPCFLCWSVAGTRPQGPGFPRPGQGTLSSGESTGGRQGRWWVPGQCSILECLLPSWY